MTDATSDEAAVVCAEPLAAAAGEEILASGGNAVDAAIAASFVQGVVNPMMCGLGGTARFNLYLARSREHLLLQAIGGAGSLAQPDSFEFAGESPRAGRWWVKQHANYIGHKASVVPTFVRVTGEAYRLFGRLPWSRLLEPAIAHALDGFPVSPWLASRWDPHGHGAIDWPPGLDTLRGTEECARIYLNSGRFYAAGETLVQPDLARTLSRIAAEGPEVFYEGEIGQAIAADFARHGGFLTYEDLLRCRAFVSLPLTTTFQDYSLHGEGPIRFLMYNILEGFDLLGMGHNSPRYLETLARAFQSAYADAARYLGDPRRDDIPVNRLISKEYAADLRQRIERGDDLAGVETGEVTPFGTTGLVVMDAEGNALTMTHSNGNSSGVVTPGLGFLYNNHMHNYDPRPGYRNSIAPRKAYVHGAGGLIACRDGRPCLAIGHYAQAGTTAEVQVFLNTIAFGMPISEAVTLPRIHAEYRRRTVFVDPDFPPDLAAGIEALGTQRVVVKPISPAVSAVHRAPGQAGVQRGIDPRVSRGTAVAP